MKIVDLHAHTTASDGSYTPTELVRYAKKKGLSAIAITDHDTIAGVEEASIEGRKLGIRVIPGAELSTRMDDCDVHMTSLFINCKNEQLIKRLDDIFYRHAGVGSVQQPQLDPLVPPFGRIPMGFLHLAGYCAASSYAYIFGNTAAGILLFLLCNRRCQYFLVFSNVLSSRRGCSPHICTAHQLGIGFHRMVRLLS